MSEANLLFLFYCLKNTEMFLLVLHQTILLWSYNGNFMIHWMKNATDLGTNSNYFSILLFLNVF